VTIDPRNVTAQLQHRAAGNPPSTLPDAAISNCFPGLEFDFRNLWRRAFEGVEVHEANGLVVRADPELSRLEGRYLIQVGDVPTLVAVHGPNGEEADAQLGLAFLEWSNALADVVGGRAGAEVACVFADGSDLSQTETVQLRVRPLFALSEATGEPLAVIDEAAVQPGELTQSLCSPWQNDYRECGCYYWAASRPDYVNVESTGSGASVGNNWMDKRPEPKAYELDNGRTNPRQHTYQDLFRDWQARLRFIVGGRDYD
jgi:hypothetical protein